MAAIAGIASPGKTKEVCQLLEAMQYRGPAGQEVIETQGATLGVAWTEPQADAQTQLKEKGIAQDYAGDGHRSMARDTIEGLVLQRDRLGVAPLYYGRAPDGQLCFASEVKALVDLAEDIQELPPGSALKGTKVSPYFHLEKKTPTYEDAQIIAKKLRQKLEASIEKSTRQEGDIGSWLSGGLDSSAMAALARPRVERLHTFAAALEGAPDLAAARIVADYIDSEHHEVIVTLEDMLAALPDVIYHLELFDALLVRSSITNYLVAKRAADYVPAVFSGEGGDELFAGYAYLKDLDPAELPDELIDITGRLHNTALQRVDRCASAHGTVAHTGFLDPDVVDYALRIPARYKLRDGQEKWILRRAVEDTLPEVIVERTKAKFWEGAGVGDLLSQYAEEQISDADFKGECNLPNGWQLNSKEELMYYRIFRDRFTGLEDLSWMGRTKGAPVH